ncbi:MAG: Plug and carboxypeptidase regulatory-like domain-containing protein, partial [Bacteroidales bacterium]|nr:Plug and carboxypeptidase regulatory-like domain-containing protein [Bacteroidales bacterium]
EKVWFRAWLVDAITHVPSPVSRYVYVELINRLDSVVTRVKICEEEGAYCGHIPIPDESPQGAYTLRAYTTFMRSQEEHYFFTKTLYVGAPSSHVVQTEAQLPNDDFDVSFYPEGGSLMLGAMSRVAFKAVKSNGQSTEVLGAVYNQSHEEVGTFRSIHLGMGSFHFLAQKGERYYAICTNEKGQSKFFDLPSALDFGYSLSVSQMRGEMRGNLHISVQKPAGATSNEGLYLLAHTRGMIHFIDLWDHEQNFEIIAKEWFPSGVLHLILFNADLHPLSERLVFINNDDQAQVVYRTDKDHYTRRSLVKNSVTITDINGQQLDGTFSVSVTSDREVTPDITSGILTQLLLTSDLRGYIQNPALYFQSTPESESALDLLMLTQGWRRYDIAALAQGRFTEPAFPIEWGQEVSGSVQMVSSGKAVEDVEVQIASLAMDGFFHSTQTDSEGRFRMPIGEFPDSTRFIVSAEPPRRTNVELILEKESFPDRTLSLVYPVEVDRDLFLRYAYKAEQQYVDEGGIRVAQLSAALVTADRKPPLRQSQIYRLPNSASYSVPQEQLEQAQITGAANIYDLIGRMPGVEIRSNFETFEKYIYIRGTGSRLSVLSSLPLLLIDDIPVSYEYLNTINIQDIAQIDVLNQSNSAMFGIRGENGVISIYTKRGSSSINNVIPQSPHIKAFFPLGSQQPVAFYAPKYETQEQLHSSKRDVRTTISWQPVVPINSEGVATFEFYTSDELTSYTVVIEGVADDGTIIRKVEKLTLL